MPNSQFDTNTRSETRTYDAGLRAHMNSVYTRMSLGVLVTAIVAMVVGLTPALLNLFLGGPQAYIFMFAPLAVLWFGFRPEKMASGKLQLAFFAIAALYGISFATIATVASADPTFAVAVGKAFFIAVGMFAGLSIFGYTTKKDLTAVGTFAVMGIWGVFIASIIGMFFSSPIMHNVIAGVGILAFSGMTAFQTQATKEMYSPAHGDENNSRMAWAATLNLYISFIAMFMYLLRFTSNR